MEEIFALAAPDSTEELRLPPVEEMEAPPAPGRARNRS